MSIKEVTFSDGFYPAIQKKLFINWKKADSPKSHFIFGHVNRLFVIFKNVIFFLKQDNTNYIERNTFFRNTVVCSRHSNSGKGGSNSEGPTA